MVGKMQPLMVPRLQNSASVILLAAGGATRFGSAKQVIAIDGIAMVRHCALNAMNSGASLVVVTGAYRHDVENALRDLDVTTVHNADWNLGMGSSVACGIGRVAQDPDVEAAIILLADQPLVSTDDLRELMSQHQKQPDCIIAASADETIMPPCLFPRRYFAELQTLRDQTGARTVLQRYADRVVAVEMPNAAVDIDTQEAYAQFCASGRPA
jgi:molybdenum cofactor cytidylyltransferase